MDSASIIEIAGGATAVAAASKESGRPVTCQAVYKWRQRGLIPEEQWPLLLKLCAGRVGLSELHRANEETRRSAPH